MSLRFTICHPLYNIIVLKKYSILYCSLTKYYLWINVTFMKYNIVINHRYIKLQYTCAISHIWQVISIPNSACSVNLVKITSDIALFITAQIALLVQAILRVKYWSFIIIIPVMIIILIIIIMIILIIIIIILIIIIIIIILIIIIIIIIEEPSVNQFVI